MFIKCKMNLNKKFFITLFVFFPLIIFSHTVETFWEVRNNGTIRFWVRHWHGEASDSSLSNYTIDISQNGETSTITASGFVNNTLLNDNLPIEGSIQRNKISDVGDATDDDWIYFDFNPLVCNENLSIYI